jgi:hypothetical protein
MQPSVKTWIGEIKARVILFVCNVYVLIQDVEVSQANLSKFQEPFCNANMFNNPGRGFGAGAPIAAGRTKPVRSFAKPR